MVLDNMLEINFIWIKVFIACGLDISLNKIKTELLLVTYKELILFIWVWTELKAGLEFSQDCLLLKTGGLNI